MRREQRHDYHGHRFIRLSYRGPRQALTAPDLVRSAGAVDRDGSASPTHRGPRARHVRGRRRCVPYGKNAACLAGPGYLPVLRGTPLRCGNGHRGRRLVAVGLLLYWGLARPCRGRYGRVASRRSSQPRRVGMAKAEAMRAMRGKGARREHRSERSASCARDVARTAWSEARLHPAG